MRFFRTKKKISNKTLDTLIKIWRSLKSQFCWFNGSNKRVERGTYIFYGHGDDIWRHSQNNKCHYFLEESHYSREGVAVKRSPQILMNEKWSRKVIFLITWYKIDKNIILKGIFVLGNRYLDAPLGGWENWSISFISKGQIYIQVIPWVWSYQTSEFCAAGYIFKSGHLFFYDDGRLMLFLLCYLLQTAKSLVIWVHPYCK